MAIFNKYKDRCITKLSEAKENFDKEGSAAASDTINKMIEQIKDKEFVLESAGNDICRMIELSNIF